MTDRTTDPMDRRLRRHAEAWQQTLPAPRDVAGDFAVSHRSPGLMAAAAAVVVLAVILGGLALRGGQEETTPVGPGDVIPWKALPATHPEMPPAEGPRSWPVPPQVAECRYGDGPGGDIEVVEVSTEGAAGTTYKVYEVRKLGRGGCVIEGYPTVVPLGDGDVLDVPVVQARDPLPVPAWVRADHPAQFTITWPVSHHCPVVDNDELRIITPEAGGADHEALLPGFGRSGCSEGEGAQPMRVSAIMPTDEPVVHANPSSYDDLRVTGDLNLTVEPGERVRFTVTLESPADLTLDPCPDYSILTAAAEQEWGLNCADVPYVDAYGQPFLPAGTPVTFAMEADSGDRSTPKLLWSLLGTKLAIGGRLAVEDAPPSNGVATTARDACADVPEIPRDVETDTVIDPESGVLTWYYTDPASGTSHEYSIAYLSDPTCPKRADIRGLVNHALDAASEGALD